VLNVIGGSRADPKRLKRNWRPSKIEGETDPKKFFNFSLHTDCRPDQTSYTISSSVLYLFKSRARLCSSHSPSGRAMSYEATSTCLASRIAYHSFGSDVGEVASCLLLRGRLSLADLSRLNYPRLSSAAIRDSLLILLQQNCAWHAEVNGIEYFEANEEELLMRLRFGHYVKMASDQWGEEVSSAF
jgi:hypothetical protein